MIERDLHESPGGGPCGGAWRTSSRSGGDGDCVEVAGVGDAVGNPRPPVVTILRCPAPCGRRRSGRQTAGKPSCSADASPARQANGS
ncbi:DUF397 domain-containing protein [Micromonospora sp. NBC_00858]|uniref:DUF397 domain-containing protein n=1 Tax=Micromonospora sp. NBC_00858 TaxID=2975979 RepID=UPI00386D5AC6